MIQQAAIQRSPGSALLRRSFRKTFPPAVRGEGAYLWDVQGKQYLDFSGSAAVNFIGHGVSEIVSAMTEQARSLEFVHGSQFTTPIAEQYASEQGDVDWFRFWLQSRRQADSPEELTEHRRWSGLLAGAHSNSK